MNTLHCYMDFWGGIFKKEESWVKRVPVLYFDRLCPIPFKKRLFFYSQTEDSSAHLPSPSPTLTPTSLRNFLKNFVSS